MRINLRKFRPEAHQETTLSEQAPPQAQGERMYTIHGFNPFVVSLSNHSGPLSKGG
jgi:hypothetical protein